MLYFDYSRWLLMRVSFEPCRPKKPNLVSCIQLNFFWLVTFKIWFWFKIDSMCACCFFLVFWRLLPFGAPLDLPPLQLDLSACWPQKAKQPNKMDIDKVARAEVLARWPFLPVHSEMFAPFAWMHCKMTATQCVVTSDATFYCNALAKNFPHLMCVFRGNFLDFVLKKNIYTETCSFQTLTQCKT